MTLRLANDQESRRTEELSNGSCTATPAPENAPALPDGFLARPRRTSPVVPHASARRRRTGERHQPARGKASAPQCESQARDLLASHWFPAAPRPLRLTNPSWSSAAASRVPTRLSKANASRLPPARRSCSVRRGSSRGTARAASGSQMLSRNCTASPTSCASSTRCSPSSSTTRPPNCSFTPARRDRGVRRWAPG